MITLASDFGSPYPAAMKGVVRRRNDAELIDVSHDLPRGDPRGAAFWLRFVLPEFPPAVHCAVVDPGVGTDRAAIVVRAGEHAIVAPDNGLAIPPARALAGDRSVEVFEIAVSDPESATFHGRDVFAPAAATVHEAITIGDESESRTAVSATSTALSAIPMLSPTDEYVDIELPAVAGARVDGEPREIRGEVLVVDGFGNAITNVPGELVRDRDRVSVDDESVRVVETFASVPPGTRLVTVGSHGYVECDVNEGRGADAFDLAPGDRIRISFE